MNFLKKMQFKTKMRNCDYVLAGTVIKQQYYDEHKQTVINRLIDEYMANPCFEEALKLIEYNDMMVFYFTESCGEGLYVRQQAQEHKEHTTRSQPDGLPARRPAADAVPEPEPEDSPTLSFNPLADAPDAIVTPAASASARRLTESEEWMEQMIARMTRKSKQVDVKDFVSDRYKSAVSEPHELDEAELQPAAAIRADKLADGVANGDSKAGAHSVSFGSASSGSAGSGSAGSGSAGSGSAGSGSAGSGSASFGSANSSSSSASSAGSDQAAIEYGAAASAIAGASAETVAAAAEAAATAGTIETAETAETVETAEAAATATSDAAEAEMVDAVAAQADLERTGEADADNQLSHETKPFAKIDADYGYDDRSSEPSMLVGPEERAALLADWNEEPAFALDEQASKQESSTAARKIAYPTPQALRPAEQSQSVEHAQYKAAPTHAEPIHAAAPAQVNTQPTKAAPAAAHTDATTATKVLDRPATDVKHNFSNVIATLQIDIHAMSKQLDEYRHELSYYPQNDKQIRAWIRSLEAAIREFSIAVDMLEDHSS